MSPRHDLAPQHEQISHIIAAPGIFDNCTCELSEMTLRLKRIKLSDSKIARAFVVSLCAVVLISVALYYFNLAQLAVDYLANKFSGPFTASRDLFLLWKLDKLLPDKILGYILSAVAVITFLYGSITFMMSHWLGAMFLDVIWPGLPDIIDPDLEAPVPGDDGPGRLDGPFLERQAQLSALLTFAGSAPDRSPTWIQVNGPEGIGKSRLGLEWLQKLQNAKSRRRWDVGTLKSGTTALDVSRARFRRNTAIVIDTPTRNPALWSVLAALLSNDGRHLRIVLEDQAIQVAPDTLEPRSAALISRAYAGAILLERLSDKAIQTIAPNLPARSVAACLGRPLYASLGDSPETEIGHRSAKRLQQAENENERRILGLAALCGPLPQKGRAGIPNTEVTLTALQRLFDGADRRALRRNIPALTPDIFADDVLMRFCSDKADEDLATFAMDAVKVNTDSYERRLSSLWSRSYHSEDRKNAIQLLQRVYDTNFPERVSALTTMIESLLKWIENFNIEDLEFGSNEFATNVRAFFDLCSRRPFDSNILQLEIIGISKVIEASGRIGRYDQVEELGRLLAKIGAPGGIALGCGAAIEAYARARQQDGIERWGRTLFQCLQHPATSQVIEVKSVVLQNLAKGVTSATLCYLRLHRYQDVERWSARFKWSIRPFEDFKDADFDFGKCIVLLNLSVALGLTKQFKQMEDCLEEIEKTTGSNIYSTEIRFRGIYVKFARAAITSYGKCQLFAEMGKWVARLFDVPKSIAFDDGIIGDQIMGCGNAYNIYVESGLYADAERMCQWIVDNLGKIVNTNSIALLETYVEICRSFVHTCGSSGEFERMKYWGDVLFDDISQKRKFINIQTGANLAQICLCAVTHLSQEHDFAEIERWGVRFSDLFKDSRFSARPEINEKFASFCATVAKCYGEKSQIDEFIFWRSSLARVSRVFRLHPGIQSIASEFGVTYASQEVSRWPFGAPELRE